MVRSAPEFIIGPRFARTPGASRTMRMVSVLRDAAKTGRLPSHGTIINILSQRAAVVYDW
jgi:hypothetical protein